MHTLSSQDITIFLVVIGLMLILARLLSKFGRRYHIPVLICEIVAGILLGSSVLEFAFPTLYAIFFPKKGYLLIAYETLFQLSVIMLLFLAGMKTNLNLLLRQKASIFITSLFAILFPFAAGFWFAWQFFDFLHGIKFSAAPLVFPFTFSLIISISAFTIIIRILIDNKMFYTKIGTVIIGTAMVTEIVGWLAFSSILIYANTTIKNIQILYTIAYLILFFIMIFLISSNKKWLRKIFIKSNNPNHPISYDLSLLFGVCMLCAAFTNAINIHPSLGAFFAGILCKGIIGEQSQIFDLLELFIMNFFAPFFFISIGLQINLITELNIPMVIVVFVFGSSIKIIGAFVGALISGYSMRHSFIIANGLNARGSMEILMASLVYKYGLIDNELFVTFVIFSIVNALIAAPIMVRLVGGISKEDLGTDAKF
jgi:Kef-type K+ transport system membrane component KefB